MDIKEQINALTDVEAKAALEWILKYATDITRCNSCPFKTGKSGCPEIGMCRNHFLAEALKEAKG